MLDASARSGPPAVGEVVLAAHGAAAIAELASALVPGRVLTLEPAAETTRVSLLASVEPEVATPAELARVATLAAEPELTRTTAALHRVAMVERRDRGEIGRAHV